MSDVLDSFVDDAVRGAIRLAKHRKSNRVETKDMAAFLGRLSSTLSQATKLKLSRYELRHVDTWL